MSILAELRRRNVFRVAVAYLASAWLLVQVVETLFPIFDLPASLVRLVVVVLMIGFPLALVLSWLYELTPAGLRRDDEVERSVAQGTSTRAFDRAVIALLALATGYFALDKFVFAEYRAREVAESGPEQRRGEGRTAGSAELSIVVLPFSDMSPQGDLEYLSDGLAEELLNLLARVQELRVISRTSAFSYKARDVRVTDVARELQVGHVLEGSVRRFGERLRITVQLIDARNDSHLWSETYDRLLDDIFAVQDDIARQVVQKLRLTLLEPLPETRELDPEAYALYLRANHLRKQSTPESFEQAVMLYQRALAIEPTFAAAWDRLGLVYCMQANFGLLPAAAGYAACRDSTRRALQIDPDFAPALSGMGWIAMQRDGDFTRAAQYYQRALAIEPGNVAIIGDTATLLQFMGRLDEAIALSEYASARDPVNPIGFANLGVTYRVAGRLQDAIAAFRTAISLSPDRIGAYFQLGIALLRAGSPEAALEAFRQEVSEDWRVMGIALASHALGREAEFAAALQALETGWGDRWPTEVAQVYAWVGDHDAAFAWLDKALALQGSGSWPDIRVDDLLAPLHDDPRWPAYANRLGIPQAVLDEIDLSITLPR